MNAPLTTHPDWPALVDYWLGDADGAATEAIDGHLMVCDECGRRFDELVALSHGVRDALLAGRVATIVSPAFVERLKYGGRRVREYRVPRDGSVLCRVAPDDEMLVGRLAAPLQGIARLDAVLTLSYAPGQDERLRDIPFDPATGEVVFATPLADVRQRPAHRFVLRLLAVEAAGEREIGRYTFDHQVGTAV